MATPVDGIHEPSRTHVARMLDFTDSVSERIVTEQNGVLSPHGFWLIGGGAINLGCIPRTVEPLPRLSPATLVSLFGDDCRGVIASWVTTSVHVSQYPRQGPREPVCGIGA